MGRVRARVLGLLAGVYLSQSGAERSHAMQFRKDGLGHRIHTWVAMVTLAGICSRTAVAEFALVPLAAYSAVRVLNVWRCWVYAALSPVGVLMLVLAAWAWLSLLWTRDIGQGLDEAYNTRWVLLPGMLWPVLDQRRKLIGALAVGMVLANLSQVWHAIGVRLGVEWMRFPRMPDRNSGWWQPVVGGVMLTGALGLHLPAAVMGRGSVRLIGAAGAIVTLLGIFATGTRGAMLASIGLVAIVCAVAAVRGVRAGGLRRRGAWVSVGVGLAAVVGAGVVMGPGLARRVEHARVDLSRAMEEKDFYTDTGGRLLMGWKGIEAARAHPWMGIGVGAYKRWCLEDLERQGIDPATRNIQGHAHNAYIHLASSFGVPAMLVAMVAVVGAIVGGLCVGGLGVGSEGRWRWVDPGSYDAGPTCAIVGLMLVAMFDPIVSNMQTCAVLCALIGLCVVPRPGERG